jgi:hypothetical protein
MKWTWHWSRIIKLREESGKNLSFFNNNQSCLVTELALQLAHFSSPTTNKEYTPEHSW